MATLRAPSATQKILATDISDLVNLAYGVTGYGQQVRFTQLNDATNYANTFGNVDTTNGRAVKIQYGDPSGSPVTLAQFQKSASLIQSADGTKSVSVSNAGIAITGTFSISGQTVGAGVQVWNVLDYGITRSSNATDATFAAANTTALQTLVATVTAFLNVSGTIYFPDGHFGFNAPVNINSTLPYTEGLNIVGEGEATNIHIFDSTRGSPGWVIGSAATSAMIRFHMEGLMFYQESAQTAGATILIANATYTSFDRVNVNYGGATTAAAPFYAVQVGSGTFLTASTYFERCTFTCGDLANSAVVYVTGNNAGNAGLSIASCSLQGGLATSSTNSTGILFGITSTATRVFDSMFLSNTGIGTCKFGIWVAGCQVANFLVQNTFFDACALYNVYVQSATGLSFGTLQFSNCWMSVTETGGRNIELDPNGGTLSGVQIANCYMTSGTNMLGAAAKSSECVRIRTGVTDVTITNNRMGSSATSGINVIDVQTSCSNIVIANNIVTSSSSCAAGIAVQTSATPVVVQGNLLRVKDVAFGGTTSTARVYSATMNAFAA